MSNIATQTSFNSGEWAPNLNARVDLQKYRVGAALLRNFFVDYRGGASTRPGTKFIQVAKDLSARTRVIPFQASSTVSYVAEFGNGYVRFYNNGQPVLESAENITGATQANPCVVGCNSHGYLAGDWVLITGVAGMTQLNGRYFQVGAPVTTNAFGLYDVYGNAIDSSAYGAYTSGGTLQRVYTIASPYAQTEVFQVKYAQSQGIMVLCHPNHPVYVLTLNSSTNWTLDPAVFGSTAITPAGVMAATTLTAGSVDYAYVVTSVDSSGQESAPSTPGTLSSIQDLRTVAGTNTISWSTAANAVSYNIYKAIESYAGPVPTGSIYGYIGSATGTSFNDSNIVADFSTSPPVANNPFVGTGGDSGVNTVLVNAVGAYTAAPSISFSSGSAAGYPLMQVNPTGNTIFNAGVGYAVGDIVTLTTSTQLYVDSVSPTGQIQTFTMIAAGLEIDTIPANPIFVLSTTGSGQGAGFNLIWGVALVVITAPGSYSSPPTITFSSGTAAVTVEIGCGDLGNPTVPGFFNQRLVLAGFTASPQTFVMSRTGLYFNFDISTITQPDDAIQGTLVSAQLNSIKSMTPMQTGLIMFTDKTSWLLNGGGAGVPITATSPSANAQSYNGSADLPPIVVNFDALYVQAKGSIVRDLTFNIYANIYTGTDISLLSSHLFYGFSLIDWAWAEEPYKVVWATRNDGVLLALTFLKEQEFTAWAHSDTLGAFRSCCTVTEVVDGVRVDAIYLVVQRMVNGNNTQYIERLAERNLASGINAAWCVDAGVQYSGAPVATFTNAYNLAGLTVTGLADGEVIPPFVMPINGTFTLDEPAQNVLIGIPFLPQLQTLALELGDPTVQGKVKKINNVDTRVVDTLGLSIGPDFDNLTPMKDLVQGNVSSMLVGQENQIVAGLYTGDARTYLPPAYTVPGQYCFQQSDPLPATILGVFPDVTVGDTSTSRRQ